uniref:Uncharacterized protein n=1 Tax=Tanacetum cinerariifolium TaxID=118510 RepID=A0A6L2MVW3_TANCI|nr:hypothetical protein [Tanacetum cinerariifolium]
MTPLLDNFDVVACNWRYRLHALYAFLQESWCRVVVLSVSSPIEPKSRVFPPNAIQMLKIRKQMIKLIIYESLRLGKNIDNLTMEQYLMLTRGNQAPGVVKPEIGGNVNFEIKSQFMRELREDTFVGCQLCRGPYLDKEFPLNKEVRSMEEVKYEEFGRPIPNNNRVNEKFGGGVYEYSSQPQLGD